MPWPLLRRVRGVAHGGVEHMLTTDLEAHSHSGSTSRTLHRRPVGSACACDVVKQPRQVTALDGTEAVSISHIESKCADAKQGGHFVALGHTRGSCPALIGVGHDFVTPSFFLLENRRERRTAVRSLSRARRTRRARVHAVEDVSTLADSKRRRVDSRSSTYCPGPRLGHRCRCPAPPFPTLRSYRRRPAR